MPRKKVLGIWDLESGKLLGESDGNVGTVVVDLVWSPDGNTIRLIDASGTTHEWDSATCRRLSSTKGPASHGGPYSADRKLLASYRAFGTATIWDVPANRELGVLVPLPCGQSIAISPEGHYRGSPKAAQLIVYVVKTARGQETLTPEAFAKRYGWKNDPSKVRMVRK